MTPGNITAKMTTPYIQFVKNSVEYVQGFLSALNDLPFSDTLFTNSLAVPTS